jgi:VIT1/CCC1 family predicted Fe2+/Mn2+ transporter
VIVDEEERRELCQRAFRRLREYQPKPVGFEREDFYGAVGVVLITVLTSLPLVIPLVLMRDMASLALRASNLTAIVMLFCFGHRWARYSGSHPIRTGSLLALLGLALVMIAIPLGG